MNFLVARVKGFCYLASGIEITDAVAMNAIKKYRLEVQVNFDNYVTMLFNER